MKKKLTMLLILLCITQSSTSMSMFSLFKEMAKELVQIEQDNQKNKFRKQIEKAIKKNNLEEVKTLFEKAKNKKLNFNTTSLGLFLTIAAQHGKNLPIITYLLETFPSIEATFIGSTIRIAAKLGFTDIAKYLWNKRNNDIATNASRELLQAFMEAARYGNLEIIKYLWEKAPEGTKDIYAMLYTASSQGHLNVIKFLFTKIITVKKASFYLILSNARKDNHLNIIFYVLAKKGCHIETTKENLLKETEDFDDEKNKVDSEINDKLYHIYELYPCIRTLDTIKSTTISNSLQHFSKKEEKDAFLKILFEWVIALDSPKKLTALLNLCFIQNAKKAVEENDTLGLFRLALLFNSIQVIPVLLENRGELFTYEQWLELRKLIKNHRNKKIKKILVNWNLLYRILKQKKQSTFENEYYIGDLPDEIIPNILSFTTDIQPSKINIRQNQNQHTKFLLKK